MRVIKFRAWNIVDKFMFPVRCLDFTSIGMYMGDTAKFWVYMYFDESSSIDDPESQDDVCFPGDAVELMQFTGLYDKHGKEIYEGDILKMRKDIPCEVRWSTEKAKFGVRFINTHNFTGKQYWFKSLEWAVKQRYCEIIGNVYENPNPT